MSSVICSKCNKAAQLKSVFGCRHKLCDNCILGDKWCSICVPEEGRYYALPDGVVQFVRPASNKDYNIGNGGIINFGNDYFPGIQDRFLTAEPMSNELKANFKKKPKENNLSNISKDDLLKIIKEKITELERQEKN